MGEGTLDKISKSLIDMGEAKGSRKKHRLYLEPLSGSVGEITPPRHPHVGLVHVKS